MHVIGEHKMSNKLELTWIGKEETSNIEPRILIENPLFSNTKNTTPEGQISIFETSTNGEFENMLIHGDNLLALKALETKFGNKIKCIYIDPPYNTGSAFEYYDDNVEHSIWLGLMRKRIEILRNLLAEDGSIWISIDDDEQAYLKVLCDEIFGRSNFVTTILWQKIHSIKNDAKYLSVNHDYILIYAKNKEKITFNLLPRTEDMNARYKNPDNDPRGPWQSGDLVANEERANGHFIVKSPYTGKEFDVPAGKHWVYSKENLEKMIEDNRLYFGKDGNAFPRKKRFLSEVMQGRKGDTWWISSEVGHNQEAKREIIKLFGTKNPFDTPKPERLIERVLTLATNEGDLVLDSFLGSGTTAAVAHKMSRKWIGIEMGDHAYTHCKVRMDKVIEGEQGGISKAQNWKGGGSYKFYELAPSLIVEDKFGMPIINKEYNPEMLAAAMALQEGFRYEPDPNFYWKQGKNENAYIYTTTQYITAEYLGSIASEMVEGEYLIIACKTYESGLEKAYKNIKIKKIPQILLDRCEYNKDNYNLNVVDVPIVEDEDEE